MANDAAFTPLNIIDGDVENVKICVQVFLTWKQTYLKNPTQVSSLEMILVDDQGTKICAAVKKFLIPDFEGLLMEGSYIVITNFGAAAYKSDYPLCNHNWKVNFYRTTRVTACPPFDIAGDVYQPVSFDDILNLRVAENVGIDVVGLLVSIQPLKVKREYGKDTISIEFVLQDVNGKSLNCCLWSEHAQKMSDVVTANKGSSNPIVVLINNAKMKPYKKMPQVSNQLFGCRVYINENITPIVNFKRLMSDADVLQIEKLPEIDINEPVVNTALDFYTAKDAMTVDLVRSNTKACDCVIAATVLRIMGEDGWITYGCKTCNKKAGYRLLGTLDEKVFECDNCGVVQDVWSKIRTVIRVEDKTGPTSLVLFENQLSKITGRSVSWLNNLKDNCKDPHTIPVELEVCLQKEFVFHVRITQFNLDYNYFVYTVETLTGDPEVVAAVKSRWNLMSPSQNQMSWIAPPTKRSLRPVAKKCLLSQVSVGLRRTLA